MNGACVGTCDFTPEGTEPGPEPKFRALGILVDEACRDWTRLFRLPMVNRDGQRTKEQDYFRLDVQPEMRLNLEHVPPKARPDEVTPIKPLYAEQPDPDEAEKLLWTDEGGRRIRTEWWKGARQALKRRKPTL